MYGRGILKNVYVSRFDSHHSLRDFFFEKNNFRDGWTNFNSQENNNSQEPTEHIPVKIFPRIKD